MAEIIEEHSFIKNVNALASKLDIIIESNDIFDDGVVPVLREIAELDLREAILDLQKGNYLGNRKIDINLALNMEGIDAKLIEKDPDVAEAIWTDPSKTVLYDSATCTFVDGTVIELPFIFDGNPTTVSTHADLLTQFTRLDYVYAQSQVDSIYQFTALDNENYVLTIDNIPYTFTSGVGATRESIIAGIANMINSTSIPITANVTETSLELTAYVAGNPFYLTVSSNMQSTTIAANIIEGPRETEFLAKLDATLASSFAAPVVGEFIRFFDVIGDNSNLERIQLHAVSGNYKEENPIYYWAKTTSAFQTLAMRAGDVIKLGNEIDKLILLANSIEEVRALQERIPQLVDNYDVNGNPLGETTIYNSLDELMEIHSSLNALLAIYDDIRATGNQYVFTVGDDLQTTGYTSTVGTDLQDANSKVTEVGTDLQTNNFVGTVGTDLQAVDSKVIEVATDLQLVNSPIKEVATNLQTTNTVGLVGTYIDNVNTVATDITNVNTTATDIVNVNTVATNIVNVNLTGASILDVSTVADSIADVGTVSNNIAVVNTVAANIVDIQNAEENADIATAQAVIATTQAGIATTKSNEIKNVSVGSTITGAPGTNASVFYNPADGKFTFVVPQGVKGDRGEAFEVNSVGLIANRSIYDSMPQGFSFLAIDEATIYFKLSNTAGDWSMGSPFGKGDKGDTGDDGNGIAQITFTSTTHASGLAGQSGGVDTYTIFYTNGTRNTFTLINGVDGQESLLEAIEVTVDSPAATYTVNVDTTSGSFEVFLNGLKLASTDYTLTGTSVVVNVPVDANDLIVVKKLHTFSVLDTYSQSVIDSKIVNERSNVITLTGKTIDSISNTVGADHIHYKVRNITGTPLVKGTLVKAAGSQPGTDYIIVEPTTSTEDVAIGVVHSTIDDTTGWVGLVVHTGEVTDTNTSAWAVGTILYTGAGGNWTTVKPTSGTYQASGYVLRRHSKKGIVLVEFSEPAKIYSEDVQTISTTTKYVDSVTAVNYKLYLENGNIVMEEL